jgi:hypothetical protein
MQSLRFQAERRRAVGPTGPAAGEMQGRAGEAVGAGMEPFLPDDDAHPGRPADLNEQAGDVRHPDAVPDLAVSARQARISPGLPFWSDTDLVPWPRPRRYRPLWRVRHARRGERLVSGPEEHVVDQARGEQFANPAQTHVA